MNGNGHDAVAGTAAALVPAVLEKKSEV